MTDVRTVRWGIVGCGNVCEVKSGPPLQLAEGSDLVAVMRRDGAKARDFAQRHGVPKWYSDADALIQDPDINAIYIATPVGSHAKYALQCAAAGKPVYVEKPMARNHPECTRMNDAFEAARLPLFVAYYRRALPRFVLVKDLIEEGRLGRITGVCYRLTQPFHTQVTANDLPWRVQPEHSGGGLFMDLGSHTLDILDFLLGPLARVTGCAGNLGSPYQAEDVVAVQFTTNAGAPGVASWNFAAAGRPKDEIEVFGTRGTVSLSTFGNEPVTLETPGGQETFDKPNPKHVQFPLVVTIVDHLRGLGQCPSMGSSAARTAKAMDTVLAGHYRGRSDDFWHRPETWQNPGNVT